MAAESVCVWWITLAWTVCVGYAAPVQQGGGPAPSPPPQGCQTQLSTQIEQCMQPFVGRYTLYSSAGPMSEPTEAQNNMEDALCSEYEQTLQCLHLALAACPPADRHLTQIATRLGHLKGLMETVCRRVHERRRQGRGGPATPRGRTPPTPTTQRPSTSTKTSSQTTQTVPILYDIKIVDTHNEVKNWVLLEKTKQTKSNDSRVKQQQQSWSKLTRLQKTELVASSDSFDTIDNVFESAPKPEMKAQTSNCDSLNGLLPECVMFRSAACTGSSSTYLHVTVALTVAARTLYF